MALSYKEIINHRLAPIFSLIPLIIMTYLVVHMLALLVQSTITATVGIGAAALFGWLFGRRYGVLGAFFISLFTGKAMMDAGLDSPIIIRIGGVMVMIMAAITLGTIRHLFVQLKKEIRCRQAVEHQLIYVNEELNDEKDRSENLLLNVLPLSISNRLKENPSHIADSYPEVSIIFADIVGFTKVSAGVAPNDLVHDLNTIFTAFDTLTKKYGLEKIKTIGDSYMAVAGLPDPQTDHEQRAADMALEMIEASKGLTIGGKKVSIRIGLNSGEVTAGVIGSMKFLYDLWGDAVNTASRMEMASTPNQILVPESFYNSQSKQYEFTDHGVLDIKGKGDMRTYFLDKKRIAS